MKKIITLFPNRFKPKHISMKFKSTFLLLLAFFAASSAFAQSTESNAANETYQPNLRGNLMLAFGFNALNNAPADFQINPWRSKSVNIYYFYEIPLGNSKFTFNPGIGLGLEKYQFKRNVTLAYANTDDIATSLESDLPVLIMQDIADMEIYENTPAVNKNRLAANYIDVPLEFAFHSKKSNPKAGLNVALGGKIGYLYSAHTKVKYEVVDESRKVKMHRDWDLNPFRYSAHTRIGYGGFNVYFEYQLSDLFDNEFGGPLHRTSRDNEEGLAPFQVFPEVRNFRIGLALDLF